MYNGSIIPDVRAIKVNLIKDAMTEVNEPYNAKNIFYQLVQRIKNFEATLDQEHEVGMQLVSFGQITQFSVTKLSYMNPSIIWFEGILPTDGSSVELIQHVSQLSFLMIALKRQHPERSKKPIGFCPAQNHQLKSQEQSLPFDQEQESAATTE